MKNVMEYKGYHAKFEYENEDETFVGTVLGIADKLYFEGESVDELKEMFHQSIDNYLTMCKEYGKAPDKEFKGSFNVRIDPELHKAIATRAAIERITLNKYVTNALEASLASRT